MRSVSGYARFAVVAKDTYSGPVLDPMPAFYSITDAFDSNIKLFHEFYQMSQPAS
jgi:hypothetical protein